MTLIYLSGNEFVTLWANDRDPRIIGDLKGLMKLKFILTVI